MEFGDEDDDTWADAQIKKVVTVSSGARLHLLL